MLNIMPDIISFTNTNELLKVAIFRETWFSIAYTIN